MCLERELVAGPWTSSRRFSHMLWLKVHSHRLLTACLLGSKRKLPPPACQARLGLPSVVCCPRGLLFLSTVYMCNQGLLSSAWAHCISCALSACSHCRRCCCCRQCMETRLNFAGGPDLRLSCIYFQSFLLCCFFPSQDPPDTFLEWFSYDNKVISKEVLPGDPRAELAWQGFKHRWRAASWVPSLGEHWLSLKFFPVPLTNMDTAPHIGIHPLHQSHNPLLHTKFSQRPPDDLLRHSIKGLLQGEEINTKIW